MSREFVAPEKTPGRDVVLEVQLSAGNVVAAVSYAVSRTPERAISVSVRRAA